MLGEGAGEIRGFFVTASGRNVKGEAEGGARIHRCPTGSHGLRDEGAKEGPEGKRQWKELREADSRR
jgi:hypothetical protein